VSPSELLAVGRIARAHGVRGEVSVQPLTEVEERFAPGSTLLLGPDGDRSLTVKTARPHTGRLLIRFDEVPDRTAADELRGRLLLADAATSPARPEGTYWAHQVVGLRVVTEEGRELGPVREILHSKANDVWVTEDGSLIPALADVVASVDLEAGRVTIRAVPGLLEEEP
jgi:16S rRNA processing protein RimM